MNLFNLTESETKTPEENHAGFINEFDKLINNINSIGNELDPTPQQLEDSEQEDDDFMKFYRLNSTFPDDSSDDSYQKAKKEKKAKNKLRTTQASERAKIDLTIPVSTLPLSPIPTPQAHPEQTETHNNTPVAQAQTRVPDAPSAIPNTLCKHYHSGCKFGDQCRYSHNPDHPPKHSRKGDNEYSQCHAHDKRRATQYMSWNPDSKRWTCRPDSTCYGNHPSPNPPPRGPPPAAPARPPSLPPPKRTTDASAVSKHGKPLPPTEKDSHKEKTTPNPPPVKSEKAGKDQSPSRSRSQSRPPPRAKCPFAHSSLLA
jgi:hypothetical protein